METKPTKAKDVDYLYAAVMTDTEALEDARMTLEIIKKTDPGVYDEMIDESLALIMKALGNSLLGVIDRLSENQYEEGLPWES